MYRFTPAFYALSVGYLLIIVAGVWVVIDSLRPKRRKRLVDIEAATGRKREPLVIYQLYCGFMVILYLMQQVAAYTLAPGGVRSIISMTAVLWTLFGIFVMFLYLLRVVFPPVPGGSSAGTQSTLPADSGVSRKATVPDVSPVPVSTDIPDQEAE
jgi:predicted acyltransferase